MDYVKIQWIEFENLKTGLKIERINFNEDITLLVGLSGVGKTQVLNAVEYSLNLAVDKDVILRPYRVGMGILIDNDEYEWIYEINEISKDELIINEEGKYEFSFEKLLCNGKIIFERKNEKVRVIGYDKVPQPKKDESLILQYSENENFEILISGIRKLYSVEIELAVRGGIRSESFSRLKSKVTDTIRNEKNVEFKVFSHLPVALKLYIAKRYYLELYIKIFEAVKELFIEIEDIDVEEDNVREMYLVSIQVYGKKLLQHDISNGMLKTIYYIVELFTMSEDSLVLIDEFENGLGVNCIDLLSELMLSERNDLQFIITSHHPKIINAIDKDKWRIIDRDDCVVKNSGSLAYGIGNSQHDAYFNLINRWEFEGKI
ncbi:MAG: ATP-binding protein [Lachnospiraceae bacterium]|nr:ATP-binding protein [Lachnospiraceae bacterium]MDE7286625.1 ATP-binding protein [Lachnospiraceae bacterium]